MRLILPGVPARGGSAAAAPRRRSCDGGAEPPKTSCSSYYYSSNSHYNEAIADCIEFFNKSSQGGHVFNTARTSDVIMIRFILLQNRQGKTRLAKYYIPLEESEKHKVEYEVHRLVVNRDPKFTNFVEFRTHKVIYRRYAGLFFSLCVDITDNELAYLECIHLFVEILDHFFSNVCELDLVFNFHKIRSMAYFAHCHSISLTVNLELRWCSGNKPAQIAF
ncbi:UNVERIFIED_CONTAM: AP-2 complex subunit sigma [Sesamum indicum]